MEKMVVIDGKEIRFRNSASMLTIYKAQTGRDLLSDFQKMQEAARKSKSVDFDSETLCAIAWSMAKCADKTAPSLDEWLDQFEMMSLLKALPDIYDLMNGGLKIDRKNV